MTEPIVMVAGHNVIGTSGGHGTYVRAHARAALKAGFQPHLFGVGRSDGIVETEFGIVHHVPELLNIDRLPFFRYRRSQLVWRYQVLARAVASFILADRRVKLIHSFGAFGCVGVMAHDILLTFQVDTIPILSCYDTFAREAAAKIGGLSRAHGLIQQLAYRFELIWTRQMVIPRELKGHLGSRLVLVNYESVRRALIASYDSADKIRKLPYGSEMALQQHSGSSTVPRDASVQIPPGEAALIVAVSRHDPRKGVDILLQALARLERAGVRFRACVVGPGALLARHRRLAARLGLGPATVITGPVPEARPYLECADVFVLPSLEEGSGSLSLLEALQAGVACIASDVDGIPEDVVDGQTALLVPPGDPEALAHGIGRLLADATLRRQLAEAGRRTFETRFSAEVFSTALAQTYAELGVLPRC